MRDVSAKVFSLRTATARSVVRVASETMATIRRGEAPKGDPLPVARVAAIQAVKNTPQLIPFCHTVPIEHVEVTFELRDTEIVSLVSVRSSYRTGVEMEAMAGAAAAALNFYDMLKLIDNDMVIERIELLSKAGGKSDLTAERPFKGAVVVISDSISQGTAQDRSGAILSDGLASFGAVEPQIEIVADEVEAIRGAVRRACAIGAQIILSTGGTGLGPRDVTPEALQPLFTQTLPGVVAMLQNYSLERVPLAMLSRLTAGRIENAIVVCLPGAPGACKDALACLFPYLLHALDILEGGGHRV